MSGCHGDGPEVLTISPKDYPAAFAACMEQARDVGMPAIVADRTIGVIETRPRHIGSFMEPWRLDSDGIAQMAEATVQFERRRVRFEFVPVGFTLPAPSGAGRLTGPDIPGSTLAGERFDLENPTTDLELRAWVFIERGFTPGLKPGTWSLSLTTTWTDPITNAPSGDPRDESTRAPTTWTPIARDESMERTLLARVESQMMRERGAAADTAPSVPASTAPTVPASSAAPASANDSGSASGSAAATPDASTTSAP